MFAIGKLKLLYGKCSARLGMFVGRWRCARIHSVEAASCAAWRQYCICLHVGAHCLKGFNRKAKPTILKSGECHVISGAIVDIQASLFSPFQLSISTSLKLNMCVWHRMPASWSRPFHHASKISLRSSSVVKMHSLLNNGHCTGGIVSFHELYTKRDTDSAAFIGQVLKVLRESRPLEWTPTVCETSFKFKVSVPNLIVQVLSFCVQLQAWSHCAKRNLTLSIYFWSCSTTSKEAL